MIKERKMRRAGRVAHMGRQEMHRKFRKSKRE
jgi:hypothetical protein